MSTNHLAIIFKKMCVVFWFLWWLIASWTDIVGALAHLGYLHAAWAPDTNYPFLQKSLAMYDTAPWFNVFLFTCIIVCSIIATLVFFRACLHLKSVQWKYYASIAYIFTLGYWMLFFLADQLVMNFDLEQNHMVQGGLLLLTYMCTLMGDSIQVSDNCTNLQFSATTRVANLED